MTIQIPDPGTGVPADKTGDSPWLAMTKVAANFSDQTHAASRLVGTGAGQIPLAENIKALTKNPDNYTNTTIEMPNVAVDSSGELKRSKIVSKSITTAVAADTLTQEIPTGVSPSNILSIDVKVYSNYGEIMKSGYTTTLGYFFDWFVTGTGVVSISTMAEKTHIRYGFFKIYLTYQS